MTDVFDATASVLGGVTAEDICGPRKTLEVVFARRVAAWAARLVLSPQPGVGQIARAMQKNHTTIVDALADNNPAIRAAALRVRDALRESQWRPARLRGVPRSGPTCVGRGETRCAA